MSAIKDVVSEAEAESIRLDKTFAGLGAENNLGRQFERLGQLGREAFGEMSAKAQQLVKDIQEDTVSLSNLEKMQRALNDQYEAGKIPLDDYISAQARLTVLHENISNAIRTNEQALRSESATMGQAEDSMASMQRQVALLTTSYMNLSQAQRESTEGQQILKNLSDVQTRLQNASAAMSKYGGAANKQFNGLNFSIQQIAREMPTLAMGPQMFFMAISNNLPMFTDELARARKEYAQFKAEGKSATPVWKQMVSSIFSWQTALVAGITLLTAYGNKIVSWIGAMLKGREAVISTTRALKDMQKAADFDSAGQQIANFKRLADLYREIGDNAEEKQKFIEQYEEEIKKTGLSIADVNEADNAFVDNADAFVESARKRTLALAGQKLAQEQYVRALEQRMRDEQELADAEAELERLRALPEDYTKTTFVRTTASGDGHVVSETRDELIAAEEKLIERIKERSQTYMDAGNSYISMSNEMEKAADEALDRSGIDTLDKAEMARSTAERIEATNDQQSQIDALMDRNAKERARREVELQHQIDQAAIDAMKDGHEKDIAQSELDNEIELETIRSQKEEYKQAVIDGEKEVFEAQEKLRAEQDKNYVKKIFDPNSVKVDTSLFDRLESEVLRKQLASEQKMLSASLKEVETYEQARLRIQEEYAEKRKALTDADGSLKDGVTQGNLDELTRQEQEALESISVTFAMRDAAFEQWSRNLASQTAAALDLMLSEAMEQLSILENTEGVNPEEIAKATAKVVEVREALRKAESDTDASEAKWTELNEVLRDSASVFSQLGEVIPGVAGQLLSGIGSIATSAVSMANAINGITTATTALEKASGVIAAVSAGLQVLSAIPAIINANKEANEAAARAAYEYAQALQEVADAQMLASNNSIFGDNAMASFFDNMAIAKRELGEIQEVMDKAFEREQKAPTQGGWVLGGWLGKAPTVNDYTITSDMRSGWQKFWGSGRDNIHTINLQDYVNQDGILDYARLEAAYNAYKDGIAESDRQLIEELIANGKQYEAAMEEAASYISGLFSDLSGNIADAMIDAFQKTGNAAINAGDIISDVAKNFAKSWIENKLLEDIFNEKAQDRMFDLMEKGDTEGALDYLSGLIGEANALAPQITEYLRGLDGLATEIEEPEQERTSTAKGIAQASQDSVDENNARLTTIQGHTYSISADMKVLVSASAMMLDRLAAIETNTARLENIESGIAQMRSDISYMNTKGLFLRK